MARGSDIAARDSKWVAEELKHLKLADRRLERRAHKVLGDLLRRPGSTIPQACGDWAGSKAAYRFFDNERVETAALWASHREALRRRVTGHEVVLAVQDSTSLNYTNHPATSGLGAVGSHARTRGLLLHSTLAFSPEGRCLGVLDVQVGARLVVRTKRARKAVLNRQPVEEKESVKWLCGFEAVARWTEGGSETPPLVHVCDREGDLYELLLRGQRERGRCDVLVRAVRKRRVSGEERFLWEVVGGEAPLGLHQVRVPRRPGVPAREVTSEIRCRAVELPAPRDKAHYFGKEEALQVWAIEARQVLPQAAKEPICWRLLTTIPTTTLAEACEKVAWYTQR